MENLQVFDPKLIGQFRDQFNNGGFGYLRYRNRNGKDDYSAICSAMDWIEVAIDYINSTDISTNHNNIISMQIFSLIMAVDIIYSCITTMHRVIFATASQETPFSDCFYILKHNKSDNRYFKDLRAAFGAHPTDLYGETKGETKYASWSVPKSFSYDFVVFLYSSIPDKEPDIYGFSVDDLIRFAKSRYEYLEILINEIRKQDDASLDELRLKPIKESINFKERIKTLKEAAEERYGREGYYYAIVDIETMLNAPCSIKENEIAINKYKQKLHEALDNVQKNLQQMAFERYASLSIINPDYHPAEVSYDLEKIFEAIRLDGLYRAMLPFHLERVKPYLRGIQCINPELESGELLLLMNAGLFFAAIEEKEKR